MKIALATLNYRPRFDPVTGRDSAEALGIKYLAAGAERQGHQVLVVDAQFRDLAAAEALREIIDFSPDLVGLSLTDWVLREACRWVEQLHGRLPAAFVCAGGPGATAWHDKLLQEAPALGCVVLGEGELSFDELVSRIANGADWRPTTGIAWRAADGSLQRTPPRPFVTDLDTLPRPRREPRYPLDSATLCASRGCRWNCGFCHIARASRAQPGPHVRFRRPEAVVAEMRALHDEHGVRWFNFVDDMFTGIEQLSPGWMAAFTDGVREAGMEVSLFCESRADDVTPTLLDNLKRAGLKTIALGIETSSPRVLKKLSKGITRERNAQAIRLVQDRRIHFELFSMLIEADTTLAEIQDDIRFFVEHHYLQQNDPVPFSVQAVAFRAYPFRHTALYGQYLRRGILRERGFSIEYDLQDPQVEQFSRACMALHQRIPQALERALNFSYVGAIQAGQVATAVREKRFGNQFLRADLDFVNTMLALLSTRPGVSADEVRRVIDATVDRVTALERQFDTEAAVEAGPAFARRWNRGHLATQ